MSGTSSSGGGVNGRSTDSDGVFGFSNKLDGVEGQTNASALVPFAAGVEATNNSTAIAFRANGFGGPLFVGNNSFGVNVITMDDLLGILADGEIASGVTQSISFGIEGDGSLAGVTGIAVANTGASVAATGVAGAAMYVATNSEDVRTLLADDSGNLTITGQIFTAGVCAGGCTADPKGPGTRVVTYASREAGIPARATPHVPQSQAAPPFGNLTRPEARNGQV